MKRVDLHSVSELSQPKLDGHKWFPYFMECRMMGVEVLYSSTYRSKRASGRIAASTSVQYTQSNLELISKHRVECCQIVINQIPIDPWCIFPRNLNELGRITPNCDLYNRFAISTKMKRMKAKVSDAYLHAYEQTIDTSKTFPV